jgi:hypothetical protein
VANQLISADDNDVVDFECHDVSVGFKKTFLKIKRTLVLFPPTVIISLVAAIVGRRDRGRRGITAPRVKGCYVGIQSDLIGVSESLVVDSGSIRIWSTSSRKL